MRVFDLLLNSDFDLDIRAGDFVVGESTEQHQALLLQTNKGEWRESPQVGVGISIMVLDDASGVDLISEIQQQMELDGQEVLSLTISKEGELHLQGYYKDSNG